MKISNSKKQLAKIISENGGWREGAESAAQCNRGEISFWHDTATKQRGEEWCGIYLGEGHDIEFTGGKLPNWHQTVLARDEYFHLYPAPCADGWIEHDGSAMPVSAGMMIDFINSNGGGRYVKASEIDWGDVEKYRKSTHDETSVSATPTIEQLAAEYRNRQDYAERKQQEADEAKAEAEVKLAELVAAGKAVGLVVSVAAPEPELVVNDWRDLQVGDIIECIGSWEREDTDGRQFAVTKLDQRNTMGRPIGIEVPEASCSGTWGKDFKFIRRP